VLTVPQAAIFCTCIYPITRQ